jgi:thimet oligopeptidase
VVAGDREGPAHRVRHGNLSAPGAARRYRAAVFAPGSSKPAATLVRDFLGRPFSATAWEEWLDRETPAPATN